MKSFITKSLNWPLAENSATFINFALRERIFLFYFNDDVFMNLFYGPYEGYF